VTDSSGVSTGKFSTLLTGLRLCVSRRRVRRGCEVHTNFADESVCLMADNIFELKEVINFVDRLAELCFTASSAVYAWKFV
jgi:hypothetical protein